MPKLKLPYREFEWTPELAYAVGLLVTDGNLSGDGRHIAMRSIDKDLLETFRNCLNLKNIISGNENLTRPDGYKRAMCYRVQFSNVQLFNWLVKIGVTPAKTYTIGAIEISDLYFRDFLRGHLDGDGSVRAYVDRYNAYRGRIYSANRLFVSFISASKTHILWLRQTIYNLIELQGALIKNPSPDPNRVPIWEIKFAKKESVKLLNWIYYRPDLPCLERKRILAEKAIQKILGEKRKIYEPVTMLASLPRGQA